MRTVAFWFLGCAAAAAPPHGPTWTTVGSGTTTLRLSKPSVEVSIVVTSTPLPCTTYGLLKGHTKGGVAQIRISVDSRPLFVPYSLASCVWDPSDARLEQAKDGTLRLHLAGGKEGTLALRLAGSDKMTSYLLTVEFDGKRVKRRRFEDGGPGQVSEETIYYQ